MLLLGVVHNVASVHEASGNVAIVGGHFPASDSLASKLHTEWALIPAAAANASVIARATAFIEAPLSMLASAASGKLYQYEFTGEVAAPCCPPRCLHRVARPAAL